MIAIIPARGGSKGIKNKNLKKIGKYSLIERAVNTAFRSKIFDEVYVSSDCPKIEKLVLEKTKASFIKRPKNLAGDHVSTDAVLKHFYIYLEKNYKKFQDFCLIQCTSPFFSYKDLCKGYSKFVKNDYGSLFGAIETHTFLWRLKEGSAHEIGHNKSNRQRRQDLDHTDFIEAGSFYFISGKQFSKYKHRFCGKVGIYPSSISKFLSFEIDNLDDLKFSRMLHKFYKL